jgi:pimeloyl-ACP methyl ester carboxylesterase
MHNMLNYTIKGEGVPLILLHGFLESSIMWDYLPLDNLGIKLIYIDLPGHGRSIQFCNLNPTIDYFASCVIEVLDILNIDRFHILGHSMGGYVALNIAKQIPNKIITCGLLNSNFWSDSEEKKKDRTRVVDIVYKNKNIFINEAIPRLFYNHLNFQNEIAALIYDAKMMSSEAIAFASIAMRDREDNTHLINGFNSVQIYIIQGDQDKTTPLELMNERLIDKEMLTVITNSGHMSHIEHSEQVFNILVSKLVYSSMSN